MATPTYYGKDQYQGAAPDYNKLQQGQAVDGASNLNWYHTGALGGSAKYGGNDWIQAAPGFDGSNGIPGPTADGSTAPAGPQTAQQAITQPATVGAQVPQGGQQSIASSFQQALLNRLNPGPVSAASPEIAGAITANKNVEQRGMEKTRALLAERAAAQGFDQNAMNSQLLGAQGESTGRQATFAGNATMGLAQQRAQEITAALALGGNMLSDIDRQNLAKELAQLQAQVQREGTAAQVGLGQGDLALRQLLGTGQLNLGLLNALLGNQQFGIGQNNSMLNSLVGLLS